MPRGMGIRHPVGMFCGALAACSHPPFLRVIVGFRFMRASLPDLWGRGGLLCRRQKLGLLDQLGMLGTGHRSAALGRCRTACIRGARHYTTHG